MLTVKFKFECPEPRWYDLLLLAMKDKIKQTYQITADARRLVGDHQIEYDLTLQSENPRVLFEAGIVVALLRMTIGESTSPAGGVGKGKTNVHVN